MRSRAGQPEKPGSEATMRTIKLKIAFDGTSYHGWQTQRGDRTVQQTVAEAAARILNGPVTLHGSGRTDAGVHALGQVAHFVTASAMGPERLRLALNSLLPADIVVQSAEDAPADFHARYSARGRVYWYLIWNDPVPSPFYGRYAWHIWRLLDVPAMRAAAQHLLGEHDFSSFQGSDNQDTRPVREVFGARFRKVKGRLVLFEIHANAFLKHMVRNIMGTLVQVGLGRTSPERVRQILLCRDRTQAGPTAPPQGLFLKEVRY